MQIWYIYGCNGISLETAELLLRKGEKIEGFVVDTEYYGGIEHHALDLPIISMDMFVEKYNPKEHFVSILSGEPKNRKIMSQRLLELGIHEGRINLSSYASATSTIGPGSILHLDTIISTNCSIGKSCLINKRVTIGHDGKIGDYSVISPSVTVGGCVSIGSETFIGLGACIRDRVSIGNNVIVGMGAVVTKDIEDGVVVAGNPAAIIRKNESKTVFSKRNT